jgi:WD40 repeat protein
LFIFEVGKKKKPLAILGHTQTATCVDWCAGSFDYLLSCSDDRNVQLWRCEYPNDRADEASQGEGATDEVVVVQERADRRDLPRFFTLHHFI